MEQSRFTGDEKENHSLLTPLERRLAPNVLPRIPRAVETYHLTLLTIVWCLGILGACAAAAHDRRWLWLASAMVAAQWATDHFDGKLGKFRGTGLVRWGFYMDHLLDFGFICSILIGWSFLLPDGSTRHLLWLLALCSGFVVHTALMFASTGTFRISLLRVGPTELRIAVIAIHAWLVPYGTRGMERVLPYAAASGAALLAVAVVVSHRRLWAIDMAEKRAGGSAAPTSSVRR